MGKDKRMNREERAKIAQATIKAMNDGYYMLGDKRVDFPKTINKAIFYDYASIQAQGDTNLFHVMRDNNIKVTNRDSFVAAKDYVDKGKTVVLNFGSAKHPGGGFEVGANAQEESLCRASTLYASLISKEGKEFYKQQYPYLRDLYASHVLLSPSVVVFKGEMGKILKNSFELGVITAAAVNANTALRNGYTPERIKAEMLERIRAVLRVALYNKYDNIILGAWGCGAFGNPPEMIAELFNYVLKTELYSAGFKNIEFAVFDKSPTLDNYRVFYQMFK